MLGAILAGGLARRMGGGDKAVRRLGGRTLLDHVVARLRPQCVGLILNANGDPARFADHRLAVVPDDVPGFAGPLAGILAALDHAAAHHPEVLDVVSVAADTPFLPDDLVRRFVAARVAEDARLAIAASGGRTHPVIGLWPVAIRHALRHALVDEGERRIGAFAGRYPLVMVEWRSEPVDPFFNVNAPADLTAAEAMLGSRPD